MLNYFQVRTEKYKARVFPARTWKLVSIDLIDHRNVQFKIYFLQPSLCRANISSSQKRSNAQFMEKHSTKQKIP